MSDDILDDNLESLLRGAPARARLTPEARERIRAELNSAWPKPTLSPAPPQLVSAKARPQLRPLPRLVAVAAALLLLALGASKLLRLPSAPVATGQGDDVATTVDPSDAPSQNSGAPFGLATSGELAATGRAIDEDGPLLARPDEQTSRVPGLDARDDRGSDESPTSSDPGETGSSSDSAGIVPNAVLASVEMAVPASMEAVPEQLTLWVKPVVQLPQVADAIAYDIPLAFADLGTEGRLVADLAVENALEPVHAMGAENVLLQVELPGMAPSRTLISNEEAASGTVRFTLEPGMTFSGTVVDGKDGTPIQGALVVALDQLPLDALAVGAEPGPERLPQPYTVTDALGRYTLRDVAREKIVRLRASGGEYAPTMAHVIASAPEDTSIQLGRGTTVAGVVERADGLRWENAVVVVSLTGRDPSALDRPVMTFGIDECDANGEYSVSGLPAGNYVALVFDPADRETPVEFRQLRIKGSPLLRLDFLSAGSDPITSEGLTLDGVLVDADGQPLAAESLSLSSLDGKVAQYSDWRVSDTGSAGQFRFPDISQSHYVIHRVRDGFERMTPVWDGRIDTSQTLRIVLADTQLNLDWREAASDDRSWTILERWRPERKRWGFAGSAPTTEGEALRQTQFQHLPPGRYRAVLMGPGHGATWTQAFEVEPGRDAQTSTDVKPGASLTIRLSDADSGQVIVGAVLEVQDEAGRRLPLREALTTDLGGQATQHSVPFERITIQVSGIENRPQITHQIDFAEAKTGPLEIRIPSR